MSMQHLELKKMISCSLENNRRVRFRLERRIFHHSRPTLTIPNPYLCLAEIAMSIFVTTSFLNLLLMKYPRNLGHPPLPPLAPKLPLRRQIPRTVQRTGHNISKVLNRPLPNLQDPTTTCPAELPMKNSPASLVSLVDGGLLAVGGV